MDFEDAPPHHHDGDAGMMLVDPPLGQDDNDVASGGPSRALTAASSMSDRQSLVWSRVTVHGGPVPPPRSGAASVICRGKLYVFGGYGGGTGRLEDFFSFDLERGVWESVPVLSERRPGRRENNGVVISDSDSNIVLFGGYNGQAWLNDMWLYDIDSRQWTCIQESSDGGTVVHGNQANAVHDHAVNGVDESNAAVLQAVGGAHRPLAALVQQPRVQGTIPSRRFGYVSVVHANKFVLFGGFDGQRWLNDMFVFDFGTRVWTEIQAKGPLPTARSCPAWAKDDFHVYVHGGYDGVERKADFFALDLHSYTWTEMPCLGTPPSPRYFHSCCLYGHKLYLYAGYSGHERLADMYAYDFETHHWVTVDCTRGQAPSGRSSLVAQVYDNSLYVFAGYSGQSVLNDFYKFRLKPIGVPPPALVADLGRLLQEPHDATLADVCFVVQGKRVYAHKCLLCIRSEYFSRMLTGGMRESSRNEEGIPVITIPEVPHAVFLQVLRFLYTDTVHVPDLQVGIHLLVASELFLLSRLKALCEDWVRRDICVDNVISILVASHQHNAAGLKDIALEFILKHLQNPKVYDALTELKSEPDLLVEIIKRNSAGPSMHGAHSSHNGSSSNRSVGGAVAAAMQEGAAAAPQQQPQAPP